MPDQFHPSRALRRAAARLLPKTKRQLGERLAEQRDKVLLAQAAVNQAKTISERVPLERQLAIEVATLNRMLEGIRQQESRYFSGVILLPPSQIQARRTAIVAELKAIEADLNGLAKRFPARAVLLRARRGFLRRRLKLLDLGRDIEQPVKLHPSKIPVQRVRLTLPTTYLVPSESEATVIVRLMTLALQRHKGETQKQFRDRLRAYLQRALVRFAIKRKTMTSEQAIPSAIDETIKQDATAIEAETKAGGIVIDPAADAMEPIVAAVAPQIEVAAEDMQPPVSKEETPQVPTPDTLAKVITEASVKAEQLSSAPETPLDAVQAALESESPFEPESEPEPAVPFYRKPAFVVGIVVGLGFLLLGRR